MALKMMWNAVKIQRACVYDWAILNQTASQTCVWLTCSCSLLHCVVLKIHPDNQSTNGRKEVEIDSIKVEKKSSCEIAKYLGQIIAFQQQETAERRVGHRSADSNKS